MAEEQEYESDLEESRLPLAMRRREASDDEEGDDGDDGEDPRKPPRQDARASVHSDAESDGQGGVEVYEDYESETEEEEREDVEEDSGEAEEEEFQGRVSGRAPDARDDDVIKTAAAESEFVNPGAADDHVKDQYENQDQVEEKKENEPFSVPTAGAFYMHDDRFRDNGGGRHRRTPGGRKLWESKDDRAWVHDRFEEMNLQESHSEEGKRNSRGHFRGRGRNRGSDHRGYVRGNRSRSYDDNGYQSHVPKRVRGRGPRRYEPPLKSNAKSPPPQNKQSGKAPETTTNTNSGRTSGRVLNAQSDVVGPRKNVFASSLSSASPPFYPSGSSNQDISVTQKRGLQNVLGSKHLSPSGPSEDSLSSTSHSNTLLRVKPTIDPFGLDKGYADDSFLSTSGKLVGHLDAVNTGQSSQIRAQSGRGFSSQHMHQPISSVSQVNRASAQTQVLSVVPKPSQNPAQTPSRQSNPQLVQRLGLGHTSSPSQGPPSSSPEVGDLESPPGSSKSKTALVAKAKGNNLQNSGKGSFLYNGAQVIGATAAMGVSHGDQSFPATPALLPVMQFGGQHPGGLGVPTVGMALPGYVAQSQLGFGNSEMTWVPVLAGAAAGALGATYCPPYIAIDGGYYARPSGQASSVGGSKETTTNKSTNSVWKSPQRPDPVNDEFGQRQIKPRRYSEMNFGQ